MNRITDGGPPSKGEKNPEGSSGVDEDEPIVVPIEDSIDLHTFRPKDVKDLLDDYLEAACARGYSEVLIIHGKGSGTLRATVQAILSKHPEVESFRQAAPLSGGWGATIAVLRKASLRSPGDV